MLRCIAFLLAAAVLLGCETTVEVEAPDYETVQVVEGTVTSDALSMDVSTSTSAFSQGGFNATLNADVTVTTDQGTWTVPYVDSTGSYVAPSDFAITPGTAFELRSETGGYAPAIVRDTVPPMPSASVTLGEFRETREYAVPLRTIRITIDDPAGPNFYALHLIQELILRNDEMNVVDVRRRGLYYESNSAPLITSTQPEDFEDAGQFYGNSAYFDDALFDGTSTEIVVEIPWSTQSSDGIERKLTAEVTAVSRASFTYRNDVLRHDRTSENPFSEPVVVEGNVDGGEGMVGGFTTREIVLLGN
jgi:hypothetical protein